MTRQFLRFAIVVLTLSMLPISQITASSFTKPSAFSSAVSEPDFLKVDEAFQFSEEIVQGGVKLRWQIAPEYYLYLERFKFSALNESAELGAAQFSNRGERKEDPYFGEVHVIHDALEVFLPVSLNTGHSDAELKISYQGCAEAGLCYPPTRKQVLFIPVANSGATGNSSGPDNKPTQVLTVERNLDNADGVFSFIQESSLLAIAGIFFLLGIGLTFTPCVFPMIPIISSIIAGQQHPTTSRSFILALSYVLGMAITYAAAGVLTGMLGAGANVQAALQDPLLLSVFAAVFVALALAMFGVYELQLPAFVRDRLNTTSQGLSGGHVGSVFGIGALSALVVSPCVSAPLAGALLYISATADAVVGGLSLFALGMGMGVPLILIAVGGGKLFPKAGAWMDAVKAVFGVMLLAVAIWLLSRFVAAEVTMLLWAILLGLSATQMGAFDAAKPGWPRLFKGSGLLLAFYSALLLLGAASGAQDPLRPLQGFTLQGIASSESATPSAKAQFETIASMPQLQQELSVAKNADKPVLVDFYADWCISCKVMESQVFPQPEIASLMQEFHLVKADVTANDAANQALMEQFGLFGPPSILFFDSSGKEISSLRIVGEVTASDFRNRLALALKDNETGS